MSDNTRETIANRIRNLLAKTVENGCTEAEALAAAEMARRIMDQHRLSQSDLEVQEEPIDEELVDRPTDRKICAADLCLYGLDAYCGVETWYRETQGRDKNGYHKWVRKLVIFGLKSDVQMATYLYRMIASAIRVESDRHIQDNPVYHDDWLSPAQKAHRTIKVKQSFQVGMGRRLGQRLNEMAKAANATAKTSSGTSLVVVKSAMVKEAYEALGLKFGRASKGPSAYDDNAYLAGKAAGDRVNLGRPVGGANAKQIGG